MKDVSPSARVATADKRRRRPTTPPNLPVPTAPEPTNLLAVIARAAADPRTDTAKMQALLAMQKEIMAEEARLAFIRAKLLLNDKLPVINKDGKIEFKDKGSGAAVLKFSSFENINDIIKPLLKEFGFDLWFSSEPGIAGMINVVGHMEHELGFVRMTVFPMPHDASGGKSGAQGWASAFSFGKRVTTIGLLNIQTRALEDRDHDGSDRKLKRAKGGGLAEAADDVPPITPAQRDRIVTLITDAKINEANFCSRYGINQIIQLPSNLFDAAVKAIKEYKAQKAAPRG